MSKTNIKSKGLIFKSVLAVALIFVIILICKNLYNVQTTSIATVDKGQYLFSENEELPDGKVFVNYIDTQGKVLAPQEVLTGKVGELYSSSRKKIEGYKSQGGDPVNKIGNFDDQDINVNFVYESRIQDVNTTTEGDVVNVQVIKNKDVEYQEIKMSIITKNEEGEILKNAKYVVTNGSMAVLRNSTSYVDKLLVGSLTLASEGIDNYYIQEMKAPEGYATLSDKLKVSLNKTLDSATGKYLVNVSLSDENVASVDYEDDEIIITIVNKVYVEPEVEKIFDLEMHKSITKAVLTVDGKERVIEKKDDGLIKIDIPKSKIDKSSVKVFYNLEVKNVGEVAGYAVEVKDVIPDGMEIVPDEKWNVKDNYAITNALENVRIEPGETANVELITNWKLTDKNIGLKTNEAGISVYYNEEGLKDNTPDNNDRDSILVTVKTGKTAIITGEIVVTLVIAGGLVYVLKKEKEN